MFVVNALRTLSVVLPLSALSFSATAAFAATGAQGLDFGDAPAERGFGRPSHVLVDGMRLGAMVDADDLNQFGQFGQSISVDNDAVTLRAPGVPGQPWTVSVQTSGANGKLQAWFDWDNNGRFDADEQFARDLRDLDGDGVIEFPLYTSADAVAAPTFARFRWSTMSGLDAVSAAPDGEVEDYLFRIIVPGATSTTGPQTVAASPILTQPVAMAAPAPMIPASTIATVPAASVPAATIPAATIPAATIPVATAPVVAASAPAIVAPVVTGGLGTVGLGSTAIVGGLLGAAAIAGVVAIIANNDSSSDTVR